MYFLEACFRFSRRVASAHATWAVLVAVLAAICCPIAFAQQAMQMGNMPGMAGMQPIPPPEQLPVPIRLTGIGNSHIAIKADPEAQAWFDQGLSLMNDFWDYESQKAFAQSVRVDPNCAMCWWGLAQAEGIRDGDNKVYGAHALAEAVRLKNHADGAGKLYIEAAQAYSVAKKGDNTQEIAIWRKLVKKYPKDIEARIFLAEAVKNGYDDHGEPKAGQKEAISILEGVLRDAPNDSAANHYWIHAIEPGSHPELALKSAALLASLAPTSGHMVHIPGHIFYRVGNYTEAEHWFSASMDADEKYMREQHVSVDDDWNYVHNMMYAIANLMEQGKLAEANSLSDHLAGARGQLSATLYIWSARDQMARISNRLPVALRIADWDSVLTMLGQANIGEGEKTTNLRFLAAELSDFAAGMKALDNNDAAAAQAASDRMDAGLWRLQREIDNASKDTAKANTGANPDAATSASPGTDSKKDQPPTTPILPDANAGPLVKSLTVASLELQAGVLALQGKLEAAKKLYASAQLEEKKLGYHEPPFYIRPVGENEAAVLIRAKDYAGAKAAYEAALAERPNSGFSLYGLALVKELSGDATGAREAYRTFLNAWPAADPTLPEVAHARKAIETSSVAAR
jgi:tetratricopeptide (TPR) repeat protein